MNLLLYLRYIIPSMLTVVVPLYTFSSLRATTFFSLFRIRSEEGTLSIYAMVLLALFAGIILVFEILSVYEGKD